VGFVGYFGIYQRFSAAPGLESHRFRAFDFPILIFTLIAFGVGYDLIRDLGIPLLSAAERVPARFLIMPLVALIVLSSIRMQAFLARIDQTTTFKLFSGAAVVLLAYQLGSHSWAWKMEAGPPADVVSDFSFNAAGQGDLWYSLAVTAGGLISMTALVGTAIFFLLSAAGGRALGVGHINLSGLGRRPLAGRRRRR